MKIILIGAGSIGGTTATMLKEKGYEILYLTDEVDEFAIRMLMTYEEKEFKSISDSDLGFETEEKEIKEEDTKIFDFVKDALDGKVFAVKASKRLKTHPVCIISEVRRNCKLRSGRFYIHSITTINFTFFKW